MLKKSEKSNRLKKIKEKTSIIFYCGLGCCLIGLVLFIVGCGVVVIESSMK